MILLDVFDVLSKLSTLSSILFNLIIVQVWISSKIPSKVPIMQSLCNRTTDKKPGPFNNWISFHRISNYRKSLAYLISKYPKPFNFLVVNVTLFFFEPQFSIITQIKEISSKNKNKTKFVHSVRWRIGNWVYLAARSFKSRALRLSSQAESLSSA